MQQAGGFDNGIELIAGRKACVILQLRNVGAGGRDRVAIIGDGSQPTILAGVLFVCAQGVQFGKERRQQRVTTRLRIFGTAAGHLQMDQTGLIHQIDARLAKSLTREAHRFCRCRQNTIGPDQTLVGFRRADRVAGERRVRIGGRLPDTVKVE